MAAFAVDGKDCITEVYREDVAAYVPWACAKTMRVAVVSENGNTTTADSGNWKTNKPSGLSEWNMSMNGVLFLRDIDTNKYFALDAMSEQVRLNGLNIRNTFTDKGGYVRTMTGFIYITSSEIEGTAGQLSQYSIEAVGSGPYAIDAPGVTGTIPGDVVSDWWDTITGEWTISGLSARYGYNLTNLEVLEVDREGVQYDLVSSATPSGRQCVYFPLTGVIQFDSALPFNPSERVFVLFRNI